MPFNNTFASGSMGLVPDPTVPMFETEEQRRRRLAEQQAQQAQVTPVPQQPMPAAQPLPAAPVSPDMMPTQPGMPQTGMQPRRGMLQPDVMAPRTAPSEPISQQPPTGSMMDPRTAPSTPAFAGQGLRAPIDYETLLAGAETNAAVRNRMITDSATPPAERRAAIELERRSTERERETAAAQKQIQQAVETGNFNALARRIQQEKEGSVLKALFYKSIGMTNLALEEEKKLGAGRKWTTVVSPTTGERALVEYDADGLPMSGFDAAGRELNEQRLAEFGAGGMGGAGGIDIVGGTYVNDQTGEVGRVVTDKRTGRSFIQTDTGLKPMQGFRPQGQGGTLDMQQAQRVMQANVALAQDWAQLQNRVAAAAPEAQNRFVGEFNAKHGTNFGVADLAGEPPQLDLQTGRITRAGAQAAPAAPAQPAAPAAAMPVVPAPAAPAAVMPTTPAAPVAPGAPRPNIQATTPQLTPVVGAPGVAATGRGTPAQIQQGMAIQERAAGAAIDTAQVEPRENVKLNAAASDAARNRAKEANTQISTLDRVLRYTETHPHFFGSWIGSEGYRAFKAAQTDDARREALDRLAQTANISRTDRPEFQKLMNDIRRLELSGITSSGLSATQLNTERESQRAVSAFAVSPTDSPQAARAQALIAKAQVEYNRAWNKYLRDADKKLSPSALQDDFDNRFGDKIFEDLKRQLDAQAPGAAPAATPGFQIIERRPVR